jgi:hypothetical protein
MSKFRLSCGLAAILVAVSAGSGWAKPFKEARGEQWRAQCQAGQSKYTCCKNAELGCIADCGALQQCKNDCSASYSACVKAMTVRPDTLSPVITGEGAVLDPGPSGGSPSPRAPAAGVLAPSR